MTREEVFETLTEIFQDVFDDDEIELTDATTADDIEDNVCGKGFRVELQIFQTVFHGVLSLYLS